jgi:hypothetical protein
MVKGAYNRVAGAKRTRSSKQKKETGKRPYNQKLPDVPPPLAAAEDSDERAEDSPDEEVRHILIKLSIKTLNSLIVQVFEPPPITVLPPPRPNLDDAEDSTDDEVN